jgi:hypothetical protein
MMAFGLGDKGYTLNIFTQEFWQYKPAQACPG